MSIDPRKIINSPAGLKLAHLIGKYTPYWLGHRIAIFIANRISSRKHWKMVKIVRSNQWIVSGCCMDSAVLDKLVAENFRSIATSVFDFYHTINSPTESLGLIEPHPVAIQLVQRPEYADRGLIVAGIHMSNFDLAFQVGGLAGVKALSLTVPEFNPAYQKQYEMRRKSGLNVVPTSFGTIKKAIGYLKDGGLVITALDWPNQDLSYRPEFFGFPATLPIHHIFLALRAQVPIIVAAIFKKPDGKYHFHFSEPIEMDRLADREKEILFNAEKILGVAEEIIRINPNQWSMSFPVWPEAMERVPI